MKLTSKAVLIWGIGCMVLGGVFAYVAPRVLFEFIMQPESGFTAQSAALDGLSWIVVNGLMPLGGALIAASLVMKHLEQLIVGTPPQQHPPESSA